MEMKIINVFRKNLKENNSKKFQLIIQLKHRVQCTDKLSICLFISKHEQSHQNNCLFEKAKTKLDRFMSMKRNEAKNKERNLLYGVLNIPTTK